MKHIELILKKAIEKNGFNHYVNQQKAIDRWSEIVGKTISENTKATKMSNGVLYIETKNSTWRQELQLQKQDIVKKLNKKLKNKIIKDIRFT